MARRLEIYFNVEVRGIARLLWAKNYTSTEIYCEISAVYGPHAVLRPAIVKQCQQLEDGRTDLTGAERRGRLTTVIKHIRHGIACARHYFQQLQSERRTFCTGASIQRQISNNDQVQIAILIQL